MNIIDKYIDDLIPYDNNPRNNDDAVPAVVASISEFGFKVPIIIDKDNVIVAGHTRLKAAKRLGLKQVPCIVADDLSEEQIKAFRLADNKVAELATWDLEKLELELSELDDFGMEDFGFIIDNGGSGSDDGDPRDDEVPDIDITSDIKPGDIFLLGEHRLMCGDATNINDIDKLLDGQTINLVLTDPPYGIDIVKSNRIDGDKSFGSVGTGKIVKTNTYMKIKGDDTTETAQEHYDIVSQLCNNLILWGGNYFTEFTPSSRCWLVWDKQNTGNKFADCELAWTSFDRSVKLYQWMWNGLVRQGDRQTEGVKRVHPTQKPVGLLVNILNDFSNPDDNVLDCFGGSGSTLIACEKSGRKCYMLEYEPHYCDVIIKRWEQFTGNTAVKIS